SGSDLTELADIQPDPEYLAAFNETLAAAVAELTDQKIREIALLKLEGYANAEIAGCLGTSLTAVERKLRIIREAWAPIFLDPNDRS
ncbi:MAG: hypothetical protein DWI29_04120, partial [Planctomycetota bacterium]